MTDKQIIKKFSDGHCLVLENDQISLREDELTAYRIVLGKSTNELLEFVKDTYLQLQAKEQECESLKKQLIDFMNGEYCANGCAKMQSQYIEFHNNLVHQLDQLKVENENLKRQHQGDKGLITSTGKMNYQLLQEYDKLKNCLTEIKEIAKEQQSWNEWNSKHSETESEDDIFAYNWSALKQILQKISEVV